MEGADDFMLDLFRQEVETQLQALTDGLLTVEQEPTPARLDGLMRAAHSLKGAARMVGVEPAERVAHAMEDLFVSWQDGTAGITSEGVDALFRAGDLIEESAKSAGSWDDTQLLRQTALIEELQRCCGLQRQTEPTAVVAEREMVAETETGERTLRMDADRLDALLALAGEVQIQSAWLQRFSQTLTALRANHARLLLDRQATPAMYDFGVDLNRRLDELVGFERRLYHVGVRLYDEVVASRMRPFRDGVRDLPRRVRDLARSLNKQVELQILGQDVQVDRDILERLDAPLNHLIRNSLDHGLESSDERVRQGKPPVGRLQLQAYHRGGQLHLLLQDDGRGLDFEQLRQTLAERRLATPETLPGLSEEELTQFLFLPGFSTRSAVTELSGRGVGLDAARSTAQEMGGQLNASFVAGEGARFHFSLPITLSVLPCLLVEVAGQPFGLPLSRLERVLKLDPSEVTRVEGRRVIREGLIGLVNAAELLELEGGKADGPVLSAVVLSNGLSRYGLVVDSLGGRQSLLLQPLDERLGRVQHVSSGATLEDGSAVLVLDVDDLFRSMERTFEQKPEPEVSAGPGRRRRALVVDDSITVREVERHALELMGLDVDVAVDGVDGWHLARTQSYDLVVSDIDMPRMDGLELCRLIKGATPWLPVIIVSYKEREEDRARGAEAGADRYVSKGNFQNDSFRETVLELLKRAGDA